MNREEVRRLGGLEKEVGGLKIEVGNNTKQLEKILTNDLPHIQKDIAWLMGRISTLSPLTIGIAVGVALLIIGVAWKFIFGG